MLEASFLKEGGLGKAFLFVRKKTGEILRKEMGRRSALQERGKKSSLSDRKKER